MHRSLVGLILISCASAQDTPSTFQGEPIVHGSDPNAILRTIDDPELFSVWSSLDDGKTRLGVFQKTSGQPYLQLLDMDSDGIVDLLAYQVLDADGRLLKAIEDFGMDGQIDFIVDFLEQSIQVFYRGQWNEGVRREGRTGILVDGDWVALEAVLSELGRDRYTGQ